MFIALKIYYKFFDLFILVLSAKFYILQKIQELSFWLKLIKIGLNY